MNWLERMNNSLDFIEAHMEDKVDIEGAAKIAYSSKFHYQRMFHLLTGLTVAEYIRKRKLTLAAQELATTDIKVIDVAFKYGYDTPESFSRAFLNYHGVSPSKVKKPGVNLSAFPRFTFQIYLKGDKQMDYQIIEKEAFTVVGIKRNVSTTDGENFKIVPKFWEESWQNGMVKSLLDYSENKISYGICMDFQLEEENFNYAIAVDKNDNDLPENVELIEIPRQTFAVFDCTGPLPKSVQETFERVYQEWFPATGYEHAMGPEIEVYYPDKVAKDVCKTEIWIPIIKK